MARGDFSGRMDLLGAEEVAGLMGVEVSTVWRWCREGRLPCLKAGKHWRVRREAMEDFLRRVERPARTPLPPGASTLQDQIQRFLRSPDNVLAVARGRDLLHRLDAAFFRAGEAKGGLLVKFTGGEEVPEGRLRERLSEAGLDVERLEREGRFFFRSGTGEETGRLVREFGDGRVVWASFVWAVRTDLAGALSGQRELSRLFDAERLVIKTAVLDEAVDEWPPEALWHAQTAHSATIWASEAGLSLSRRVPMPTV
ncbi:excise: DNA binding domain, excisionase family [Rubrobacter radiotolerans]|uniref:Excise: DNA binding domain, excisionase family n=1 Tax=Rubrobacter radiotolerans TaxID=42256 RepID=A0A023X0Z7_RUBRA|nr:helix-turn-helix domain-containing protein [Rubrobacter radiotolerans]AHY45680.1 excise: DNA binding domain, excisionase family [Rubrobacter radiotolerans]MDX5893094.1 helix-turn-helix domain-containing protein [Rubrobacter radiotolerans]SMC03046.1 DNA binding domain-containing protein, excisionase family [Rubrobacter radiotolerans DSM 5868]